MQEIVKHIVKTILLGQWTKKTYSTQFFANIHKHEKTIYAKQLVCATMCIPVHHVMFGGLYSAWPIFLLETGGACHHLCCCEAPGASQQLVFATPPA